MTLVWEGVDSHSQKHKENRDCGEVIHIIRYKRREIPNSQKIQLLLWKTL